MNFVDPSEQRRNLQVRKQHGRRALSESMLALRASGRCLQGKERLAPYGAVTSDLNRLPSRDCGSRKSDRPGSAVSEWESGLMALPGTESRASGDGAAGEASSGISENQTETLHGTEHFGSDCKYWQCVSPYGVLEFDLSSYCDRLLAAHYSRSSSTT